MWKLLKSKKQNVMTDEEVIASYRASGNQELIGILYERYAIMVFGVCLKYFRDEELSKDAVSAVFEKLAIDLMRFEVQKINAWLHRVTGNYCINQLEKLSRELPLNTELNPADDEVEISDYDKISDEQLKNAIKQLEVHQAKCIELFFFEDKSYQEIAAFTGYSVLQVKSFLQNGKRNLKRILTADGKK